MVAGGTGEDFEPLTSTEVLILGDWTEWQFAADLPGPKVMMVIMIMIAMIVTRNTPPEGFFFLRRVCSCMDFKPVKRHVSFSYEYNETPLKQIRL